MLFLLLLFWQIIIHQVFTNIYTCLSSLRKSQFSYVHAHMNYGQHFFSLPIINSIAKAQKL